MLCGCRLKVGETIKDNTFVSRIRTFMARHCDMQQVQHTLINTWKGGMKNTNLVLMDATCYEVHMRFPTDIKLLWESCCFLWEEQIPVLCKLSGIKMPRSKFKVQKLKQSVFSKRRKVSVQATKRGRKTLLHLLEKGIGVYQHLLNKTRGIHLSEPIAQRFKTIRKVYQQQLYLIKKNTTKVRDRIVSLSQPHIRPVIRGKENKPLEFGIKVHMMQVDGINIVEHHSYNAFNESTRLKASFYKHKIIFGECTHLAADRIYPTNADRRFCSSKNLQTNFVAKGKTMPTPNFKPKCLNY